MAKGDKLPIVMQSQVGKALGVASLDELGKVPSEQLPPMNYDPLGSSAAVQKELSTHIFDKNNPHNVNPSQIGALALSGGTMTGNLTMSGDATVTGLPTPSGNADAVPKSFLTAQLAKYLALSGGTMSGTINMNSKKITNLPTPSAAKDAVPKDYVDDQLKFLLESTFVTGTYTGNGKANEYTEQKITLGFHPKAVFAAHTRLGVHLNSWNYFAFATQYTGTSGLGQNPGIYITSDGFFATWNGEDNSNYSSNMLNREDNTYSYLAIR